MKLSVSTLFSLQILVSLAGVSVIVAFLVSINQEQAFRAAEEKLGASLLYAEQRFVEPFETVRAAALGLRNLVNKTPGTHCGTPEVRYSQSNEIMKPFTTIIMSMMHQQPKLAALYQSYRLEPYPNATSSSKNWRDFGWGIVAVLT